MVTSRKKMTETIYYMVTSSKNKEDKTIYMMSSVTETIFLMTVETAVTVETEMTVIRVTVATEENLETMIDMVFALKVRTNRYHTKQHLTRIASANVMYFLITARH